MVTEIIIILVLLVSIWILIAGLWKFIRKFFHKNYSFIDISFVLAYFMEQITLILLLKFNPEEINLWVSLFALLVVTTASIQKIFGDGRDRKIRNLYAVAKNKHQQSMNLNDVLIEENKKLEYQLKSVSDILEE